MAVFESLAGLRTSRRPGRNAVVGVQQLEDRVVPAFATITTLTVSPAEVAQGGLIALYTEVEAEFPDPFLLNPTGTVQFYVAGVDVGSATLDPLPADAWTSSAALTVSTAALPAGSPTGARAVYSGEFSPDGYEGSEGTTPLTILPPPGPPPVSPPRPAPQPLTPVAGGGTSPRISAVGADAGVASVVRVYNADGTDRFSLTPYGSDFTGGARVAVGDLTGDGVPDVVTAPGPGGGPLVRAFDGRGGEPLWSLLAFEPEFHGGCSVSAGDIDQDGFADVVISPDVLGGPRVRVVSGVDGATTLADFFGIDDVNFRGGARTAVGDFNFDGTPDLAVVAGQGGGPRTAVFDGRRLAGTAAPGRLLGDFFVFEPTVRDGVNVAAGDVNGDGFDDLVVAGGPGGGPRVMALNGRNLSAGNTGGVLANFFAADPALRGGVRVAVGDVNGDGQGEILTGSGPGGPPALRAFGPDGTPFGRVDAFDPGFLGGVFVAGNQGLVRTSGRSDASSPLQELAISGRFLPGAATTVAFTDNHGFRVDVPATSVSGNEVRVSLPVVLDPATGQPKAANALTATVIQKPANGDPISSGTFDQPVGGLPESYVPPGTLTRMFLEEAMNQLREGGGDVDTVEWLTDGQVDTDPVELEGERLLDGLEAVLDGVRQVEEGTAQSADIGWSGPVVTRSDLALADRFLARGPNDLRSVEDAQIAAGKMLDQLGTDIMDAFKSGSEPLSVYTSLLGATPVGAQMSLIMAGASWMTLFVGGMLRTQADAMIHGQTTPEKLVEIWAAPFLKNVVGGAISLRAGALKGSTESWGEQVAIGLGSAASKTFVGQLITYASQKVPAAINSVAGYLRSGTQSSNQQSPVAKLYKTWSGSKAFGSLTRTFSLTVSPNGVSLTIGGSPLDLTFPVGSGSAPRGDVSDTGVSGSAYGNWTYYDPFSSSRRETKTESVYFSGSLNSRGELECNIAGITVTLR